MKQLSWAVAVAAAFLVGPAHATDPPATKPTLGGLPSVLTPTVRPAKPEPLAVLPIDDGKVRLFWVNDYVGTVPVKWKVCAATGTAGLTIIPVKNAAVIVPLQGDTTISEQVVPPGSKGVVAVAGVGKGELTLEAMGVIGDEITTLLSYRVSVNQAAQPPPKDPPVVDPPVADSTPYLLNIRPNGPASPSFVKAMSDPAWDEHRKAGILVRDATLEESLKIVTLPAGTSLPCTIGLRVAKDGLSSTVVFQPVAMPTESPSIKALAEKFK